MRCARLTRKWCPFIERGESHGCRRGDYALLITVKYDDLDALGFRIEGVVSAIGETEAHRQLAEQPSDGGLRTGRDSCLLLTNPETGALRLDRQGLSA